MRTMFAYIKGCGFLMAPTLLQTEGFEVPLESETYYLDPSIKSSYCTCDTRITDALTEMLTDISP